MPGLYTFSLQNINSSSLFVFKFLTNSFGKAFTVSLLIVQFFNIVIGPTKTPFFGETTSSQLLISSCLHLHILKSSASSFVCI